MNFICTSTFTHDKEFAKRVPEEKLTRILNAFVNELVDKALFLDLI